MQFKDIIGHRDIIHSLRSLADADRIPHAMLLGGPAGVGKMLTARAFAQYVQCTDRHDGDSCGICPACLQNANFANPDLHYVFPVLKKSSGSKAISNDYMAEWRQMLADEPYMRREHWLDLLEAGNSQPSIYVNEAVEISRTSVMSSYSSRYKIYIIWLPEAMNADAANKLLKLIEEPWPDTLFIMVSNDPSAILPTVFSRTQRFNFKPLPAYEIQEYLVNKRHLDSEEALRAALAAEGSILRADETALTSSEAGEFGEIFRRMLRSAYAPNLPDLFALSDTIASMGRERTARFLLYTSRQWRENYIYNLGMPGLATLTPNEEAFSKKFSPFVNERNVERLSSETDRARADILRNANARIVVFDLTLHIAQLIRA